MSNLVPEQRMDKNGRLVTRHVKPGGSGGDPSKIGAPTLPTTGTTKKPRSKKKEFQSDLIAKSLDPRVVNGQVIDRIIAPNSFGGQVLFSRHREGVAPSRNGFEFIRVQLNRPLQEGDADKIASLVGYAFKTTMRNRYGSVVEVEAQDTSYSVVLNADTSYAGTRNLPQAVEKFTDEVDSMLDEGTPVRATDRAGQGTKGTRLVDGFNEPDLKFEMYYDNVDGDGEIIRVAQERGYDNIEGIHETLSHSVRPLSDGAL